MQVLISIGTFLAALLASFIGLVLVMPFGLGIHPIVVFPVAFLFAALLAALAAGWTGTWLATDGTRTDLPRVVRTMAAMGAVLALFVIMLLSLHIFFMPLIEGSLLLALAASVATWRFRTTV